MKIHFDNKRSLGLLIAFAIVASFAVGLVSQSGSAQTNLDPLPKPNLPNDILRVISGITAIQSPFAIAIEFLLIIGGILAFIALVYSGFLYIMSAGDPEKSEAAKKNLVWAVTGVIIMLCSVAILSLVMRILSGNL